jgi:hypothetical protein
VEAARGAALHNQAPQARCSTSFRPCVLAPSRFTYELNQKLAADGLSAQVSVAASDLAGRRRLRQAGTSQLKYTIVVMVPVGKDASAVGAGAAARAWLYVAPCERACPAAPLRAAGAHKTRRRSLHHVPGCHKPATTTAGPQVSQIAQAAAKAAATDRAILRRLLQLCLPADLLATLDIDALIDAMIASTVVEADISGGSGMTPPGSSAKTPPGSGGKTPPGVAAKSVSVEVKQTIPGVSAADVDTSKLGAGMAAELNKDLAKKGLTATVTATATDSPAGRRRLQQAGGYGEEPTTGSYGEEGPGCIVVYVVRSNPLRLARLHCLPLLLHLLTAQSAAPRRRRRRSSSPSPPARPPRQ